ncbi:hypothetical protein [Micromonospora aurantiaca (nom. illeg.)]|uniref:hypothetical protein n=1 Tax=Micromonospora aurantiaca (nom. illeg.) TaxID=47850 RepID=UPI0001BF28D0|nr:hypothetical protein [Micromonospora aurantiaca]ADL48488.1 hypothetical protein Micau_4980 [Micromonospora aurantiaca ATCC 27029]
MAEPCPECGSALAQAAAGPERITCGDRCRQRRSRRLRAEADARFRAKALDLLRRQTSAVIAQDREALAQIDREAAALFGTPTPPAKEPDARAA